MNKPNTAMAQEIRMIESIFSKSTVHAMVYAQLTAGIPNPYAQSNKTAKGDSKKEDYSAK